MLCGCLRSVDLELIDEPHRCVDSIIHIIILSFGEASEQVDAMVREDAAGFFDDHGCILTVDDVRVFGIIEGDRL